jgi:hypothetical protein
MKELARGAPRKGSYRVFFVGGGSAVYLGWRQSSIDIDLYSDRDVVFRNIQKIKESLQINVEFARPEDFVPPLRGSASRHVFIDTIGPISFYHYDPYAQCLSKIARGLGRDVTDALAFIRSGMVDPQKLQSLVAAIPDSSYAKYPNLSRRGLESAVDKFLAETV